jgi:hypothetical protein
MLMHHQRRDITAFVLGVEAWPNSPANNTSVFEDYMVDPIEG